MKNRDDTKRSGFLAWISGPKSDIALFAIFLLLLNIVGARAFLRLDLTAQREYSLSASSRQTIRSLEEPLSVKVFFTKNLPSPYNSVERYLRDLLVEYAGAGSKKFSYEFFDMDKPESQQMAGAYGLSQAQIQEVKDNEVGLKGAYMGLALTYADGVEVLDGLTTSEGLEYRLTTTIQKMVSTVNALSGLNGKVKLTLFVSPELSGFGIKGLDTLKKTVQTAYDSVNKKSQGRVEFEYAEPTQAEVSSLSKKYGLQLINWSAGTDGTGAGSGVLGIALDYGDRSRVVPLALARSLFGGYGITGLDTLEQDIQGGLEALVSRSTSIGYLTGEGEKSLDDAQTGAARFASLVSGIYEFKAVDVEKQDLPTGLTSLVINGPRSSFSDAALYRIDQFIMRGGNVLFLVDGIDEKMPEGQMAYYGGQPTYEPVSTGIEKLLSKYGVTVSSAYVLDKECYVAKQQGTGETPLYYVPMLSRERLNKKEAVSRNLAGVFFLQSSPIDISDAAAKAAGRRVSILATSSPEAWRESDNISLMPYAMSPPAAASMKKENLMVLLEGSFDSAFGGAPEGVDSPAQLDASGNVVPASDASAPAIVATKYIPSSVQSGKIIVAGTSAITTQAVLDENGTQPTAVLLRNAIDYLNGNTELIAMRTKGNSLNTLYRTTPAVRAVARVVDLYLLPVLVALVGLFAWRRRVSRRRKIEARYKEAAK